MKSALALGTLALLIGCSSSSSNSSGGSGASGGASAGGSSFGGASGASSGGASGASSGGASGASSGGSSSGGASGASSGGASGCTISATLVNSCRPWYGAAVRGYPQVASDPKSQALYHEKRIGRKMDIMHTYHPVGDNTLSSTDLYFAQRANTYLYANWKPVGKWAQVASNNAGIDSMAHSIQSIAPKKLFLTVWHEPENDVTSDPNCPNVTYKGSAGTPTDYRNMWSYVRKRFKTDGVTNVVWVMNYMNYKPWQCLVPDLWPGNNNVDWVVFEAYGAPSESNYDTKVGDMYNLLLSKNDAAHAFTSKPWGIAEYGDCASTSQAEVYSYYDQTKAALDQNTWPRLKLYMVYDDNGNNAGMGCLTEYSKAGVLDPTEQQHYNGFADDPVFLKN